MPLRIAGLGLQQCYGHDRYANLELDLSQQFKGFDVGHPLGHAEMRDGFKSVSWYTVLRLDAVDSKLGGIEALRQEVEAAGLQVIEYPGGVIVKAGDFPSLGWVEREPLQAPYVLANHILKPARVPQLYGLHYGSVMCEARFTDELSAQWAGRFDVPRRSAATALAQACRDGKAMACLPSAASPVHVPAYGARPPSYL